MGAIFRGEVQVELTMCNLSTERICVSQRVRPDPFLFLFLADMDVEDDEAQ